MTSTDYTTAAHSGEHSRSHCCGWGSDANWSASNIVALVLGFVIFWPIGLFFLYWILKGRQVRDIPRGMSNKWHQSKNGWTSRENTSDNVIFNEYQQTQHDRIREIKEEIKERTRRFAEFRQDAKRRADEEEFHRFMNQSPARDS